MLPSQESKYVNERKFSGPAFARPLVTAIVEAACAPDAEFPEGVVNSIYFDTPNFSSYREKANGDNLKTKVRLRWYGEDDALPATVTAFLEVKGRVGAARDKARVRLDVPRELVAETPFESPAFQAFLLAQLPVLPVPTPLSWRPVCRIAYSRRRYWDARSASRVSIDWDIRADCVNRAFIAPTSPVRLNAMVCEFKNQFGAPPNWAEAIRAAGLAYGSFSKYGECMARLLQGEN
ncbi:MAG: VTC domain-containing protein [Kiritimatiellae bacterium]|nr:VTC domain-containing protein [Kiritimatiellia bacterium]